MPISQEYILEQYYHMVNHTNIVSKTDLRGIITFVNQKFVEISGYSEEELIGKPHNIIRDPDSDSKIFKDLWDTVQSKNIWNGTIKNIRKDGSKYIVKSSVFPVLDENGAIKEYIAIRHDITEVTQLNEKVQALNKYMVSQENDARIKLENGIVNDIPNNENCQVLYIPSDILSGDFYSIYKRTDGSIFIYLMDGQGHGVMPALTTFSISSLMNNYINKVKTLDELLKRLYPKVKNFLGEIEQLSYTMIMISADRKSISYASAGMYPFLIKTDDEIIRTKPNNNPFMNFSDIPQTETIFLNNWASLMLYSDGIIEHSIEDIQGYTPQFLINKPALIQEVKEKISNHQFDDDITMIYLKNE